MGSELPVACFCPSWTPMLRLDLGNPGTYFKNSGKFYDTGALQKQINCLAIFYL